MERKINREEYKRIVSMTDKECAIHLSKNPSLIFDEKEFICPVCHGCGQVDIETGEEQYCRYCRNGDTKFTKGILKYGKPVKVGEKNCGLIGFSDIVFEVFEFRLKGEKEE